MVGLSWLERLMMNLGKEWFGVVVVVAQGIVFVRLEWIKGWFHGGGLGWLGIR